MDLERLGGESKYDQNVWNSPRIGVWNVKNQARGSVLSADSLQRFPLVEPRAHWGGVPMESRRIPFSKGSLKNSVVMTKQGDTRGENQTGIWKRWTEHRGQNTLYVLKIHIRSAGFHRNINHHVRFKQTLDISKLPAVFRDNGTAFKVVLYSLGFGRSSP